MIGFGLSSLDSSPASTAGFSSSSITSLSVTYSSFLIGFGLSSLNASLASIAGFSTKMNIRMLKTKVIVIVAKV